MEQKGGISSTAFSPDGKYILTGGPRQALIWDVATGRPLSRLLGHPGEINSLAFSPDSRHLVTAGSDRTVRLWNTATGRETGRLDGHKGKVYSVAYSPDGRYILTGSEDHTARLWNAATRSFIRSFVGHHAAIESVAWSPDGKFIATASFGGPSALDTEAPAGDNSVRVWEASSGREIYEIAGSSRGFNSVAFSPDGQLLLAGGTGGAWLYEAKSGKKIGSLAGRESTISSAVFSPDGKFIATAGRDKTIRIWKSETREEVKVLRGHREAVSSARFSPDGKFILSGGEDATTRLWDWKEGKELAQLRSLGRGKWMITDCEGRFDTNNLEETNLLSWLAPSDPVRPLSFEVFMRDYYEPGLLTRLLKHEPLPPPRPLAEPNRAQPEVEIARVEQQKNHPDLVTVTVAVANVTERSRGVSAGQPRQSGVYDLRLFRNRQLVGQFPDGSTPAKPIGEESESNYAEALLSWRRTTQVKLDAKGQRQIRFENIRLPVGAEDPPPVEFSAYAFNEDRVKSRTARKFFSPRSGAQSFPALKGRAYLINIGVNASENGAWSLNFAADDARRIGEVLSEELRGTGNYQEVVQVSLLSDYSLEGKIKEKLATRANIEAVFHKLAGKPVADNLIKRIPRAAKLQTARPEDLVIISFSSHGIRTAKGDFYLLPFDTGKGSDKKVTPDLLAHSISSDDLSTWLKPIDAGEIVLIVDACHAASAIESKGFKPGPLGSRGFGQLAYDKGMVVLAATQADNVAIESPKFRQSLLTHALVEEGIKQRKAAMKDPRGRIYLTNWLNYAVGRVPGLFEETTNKKLSKSKTGGDKDLKAQKPELFDFRDHGQEVLIDAPDRVVRLRSSRRKI